MEAQIDINSLWNKVVDQVKLKVIHPTLWKALEVAVPIAAENGVFVVGFPSAHLHVSGNLTTSEHKNAIETALREFGGVRFSLRVIEGDAAEDWLAVKDKEARVQVLKETAFEKKQSEAAVVKAWESLFELAGRRYASLSLRALPQNRAEYIKEMLKRISDAMDDLMPEDLPVDEISGRSLARLIDRVATLTESPPALIALELSRYRAGKKST